MDLVAGPRQANIEQPSAFASRRRLLVAPGQTAQIKSHHDHDIIFAALCRVRRQQIKMERRRVASTEARQIRSASGPPTASAADMRTTCSR